MIGQGLTRHLEQRGDEVVRLVRRAPAASGEVWWDPAAGELDPDALAGAGAVVNLSGASLSRLPWTRSYRRTIVESRITATRTLVRALHTLVERGEASPALVSGSATGVYGDRPGEPLTESSPAGRGFLASVVTAWEAAAGEAPSATRVVLARTGVVLGDSGALAPLRLLTALGFAGPIDGGRQHWPWIGLADEIGALTHLIDSPELRGPVNLVAPAPATAAEIVRTLAKRMRRPYWAPVPLGTLMGSAGRELLDFDQQVHPAALLASGYAFRDATLESAIASALARTSR
jgi:uncharacterized protein (TIGR01777 family)